MKKCFGERGKGINRTFYRLRMIVLIALTTGMRIAEIFGLTWNDLHYSEGLIAVRSKLKGGKIRYVPMTPELAIELRKYPAVIGDEHMFPPKRGAKGERQRVDGSFETILELAENQGVPFPRSPAYVRELVHDERRRPVRTGEDPRPLQYQDDRKIRQTRQDSHREYRKHGARNVEANGRRGWEAMPRVAFKCSRIVPTSRNRCFWPPISILECGGQGRT